MKKQNNHRTLLPGKPGTKKYQKKYGDKLVCVRYKYDINKNEKIKTVELIVSREQWNPEKVKIPPNKIVNIRINYGEIELARKVKNLGGIWDRSKKLWQIPYRKVEILRLQDRIVNRQ
jgi:hypothetical protein